MGDGPDPGAVPSGPEASGAPLRRVGIGDVTFDGLGPGPGRGGEDDEEGGEGSHGVLPGTAGRPR